MSLFCNNSVALIDLSNAVHRLWHVYKDAFEIHFIKWVGSLRTAMPGRKLVFAIEGCGTARRREIFPEYKLQRNHDPEIERAVDQAKTILKHCACTIIKAVDGEADDAIAAYVKKTPPPLDTVIVTRDHDLWQLIQPGVMVKSFASGDPPYVDSIVCERVLGVRPQHIPMLKALLGDESDNIPRAIPKVKTSLLTVLASKAVTPQEIEKALTADVFSSIKQTVINNLPLIERNWKITQLFCPDIKTKTCEADSSFFASFPQADVYAATGLAK